MSGPIHLMQATKHGTTNHKAEERIDVLLFHLTAGIRTLEGASK